MPVIEVVLFTASETFLTDKSVINEGLSLIKQTEGFGGAYYGLVAEDSSKGFLIIEWASLEHHKKLLTADNFRQVADTMERNFVGEARIEHVEFTADAKPAFTAPTTEIVRLKLKPETSAESLVAVLTTLGEALAKTAPCHGVAGGASKEYEGTFLSVVGWDSVQAHVDIVKQDQFPPLIQELHRIADVDIKHTNLFKAA